MFKFFLTFNKAFRKPDYDFNINIARLVCCCFIVYKLFSRDFGFYATLPPEFFTFYPVEIYQARSYRLWTGLSIITEFATFHWIHWILPRPSELGLRIIQAVLIICLLFLGICGRGPFRILAIIAFIGVVYLWGHLILGAHEVDSMSIYIGLLLAFTFIKYQDYPVWHFRELHSKPPTVEAGIAFSILVFVFCAYYFASGYNKLTDILLVEIFDSNINNSIKQHYIQEIHGYTNIPDILYKFSNLELPLLDYLGPAIVYLSHLSIPVILFNRTLIWKYAIFYSIFHFFVFGVGISFLGYVFVWLTIIPYLSAKSNEPIHRPNEAK